ncbi:unnamed protein product [Staurois parvus]|uniref:Uncharacterized protein n=1 Tax=Staurois parvus TaxID=386267 RepID=A0ABN9DHM7_9NEOB|nr:unnamed protein product [Staurois parvus]
MGLVVWQQLEGHQFDTPVAKLQVPSCLCLLGVTIVTVNLAIPRGTCSLATAGGPPV